MKRYLLLTYILFISLLSEAYEIKGKITNAPDSTYVAFSFINTRSEFFELGPDMVISKVKLEEDGSFIIKGDELVDKYRFYRLSFAQGVKNINYTIGERRNNVTIYACNTSTIFLEASMENELFSKINISADNDICSRLDIIDTDIQHFIQKLFDTNKEAQKLVVRHKIVNYMSQYLDTCDLTIIKYYFYAFTLGYHLEYDALEEKKIAKMMKNDFPNSIYTKELLKIIESKQSSIPWYLWLCLIILFSYSVVISYIYFFRKEPVLLENEIVLTLKEQDVLRLISEGKLNKEIAEELSVETSTIKSHISNLYKKLNLKNRAQAADYYHNKLGL